MGESHWGHGSPGTPNPESQHIGLNTSSLLHLLPHPVNSQQSHWERNGAWGLLTWANRPDKLLCQEVLVDGPQDL